MPIEESVPEARSVALRTGGRRDLLAASGNGATIGCPSSVEAPKTTSVTTPAHGQDTKCSLDNLCPVPAWRELRRNALCTSRPIHSVMERIATFLRASSITSQLQQYDEIEGGGWFVDCWRRETCSAAYGSPLHFVINLWKKPLTKEVGDNKNAADFLVVQLDRRSGCAVLTQTIRRRLYRLLSSNRHIPQRPVTYSWRPLPAGDIAPSFAVQVEKECCERAVRRCFQFVSSSYHDQQLLGLQALAHLTSSSSSTAAVSQETSKRVAEKVIWDDNAESAQLARLLREIAGEADEGRLPCERRYHETCPSLAQDILSNAAESVVAERSRKPVL